MREEGAAVSECIIIFRNTSNQRIGYVTFDERGDLAVFKDRDEAEKASRKVPICQAYPFQIVELDCL